MAHRNWIDSLKRGMTGEGVRGYGPLIHEYVYYLLAKLSFHSSHLEFNGTFEYEEYISLKAINDPNEGYETITDLMALQDKIEQFQKLIFSHFRHVGNNECRIAALVPLVQESYGIYKFITSMLRAMHSSKSLPMSPRLLLSFILVPLPSPRSRRGLLHSKASLGLSVFSARVFQLDQSSSGSMPVYQRLRHRVFRPSSPAEPVSLRASILASPSPRESVSSRARPSRAIPLASSPRVRPRPLRIHPPILS